MLMSWVQVAVWREDDNGWQWKWWIWKWASHDYLKLWTPQCRSTLCRRQITNRFYNSPFIVFIVLSMHIVFLNSGRAPPFIQAMPKENIFFREVFLCTFVWTGCYRRTPANLVVFPPRPTCPLAGAERAGGSLVPAYPQHTHSDSGSVWVSTSHLHGE